MAGRVAESAVMGAGNITTAGAGDLQQASDLARDMVFKCGWSMRLGPINLADDDEVGLSGGPGETRLGDMSPMMASAGLEEMAEMLRRAEAKAYFGLVLNWELLAAMVDRMLEAPPHTLSRCVLPCRVLRAAWGYLAGLCALGRVLVELTFERLWRGSRRLHTQLRLGVLESQVRGDWVSAVSLSTLSQCGCGCAQEGSLSAPEDESCGG